MLKQNGQSIGIGSAIPKKYWYWYCNPSLKFVLVLAICFAWCIGIANILKSILNNPAQWCFKLRVSYNKTLFKISHNSKTKLVTECSSVPCHQFTSLWPWNKCWSSYTDNQPSREWSNSCVYLCTFFTMHMPGNICPTAHLHFLQLASDAG